VREPGTPETRSDEPLPTIVVAAFALTALLAFAGLGLKSLWIDEAYSVQIAGLDWEWLWRVPLEVDVNQSLYYLLLRIVSTFGSDEILVRLPSALATIGMAVLLVLLARRLFGAPTAVATALLVAVNPIVIRYAHEARGYALAALLAVVGTWLIVIAARTESWRPWLAYAVTMAVLVYTSLPAVLVGVAHALWVMLLPGLRRRLSRIGVVVLAVGGLLAPLATVVAVGSGNSLSFAEWNTLGRIVTAIQEALPPMVLLALASLVMIVPVVALFLVRRRVTARPSRDVLLIALWLIVPVWLASVYSLLASPVFVVRYFVTSVPAAILLLGWITTLLPRRAGAVVLGLCVIVSAGLTASWFFAGEREEWEQAAGVLAADGAASDALVVYDEDTRLALDLQLDPTDSRGLPRPAHPSLAYGDAWRLMFIEDALPDRAELEDALAGVERAWVVLSHVAGREEGLAVIESVLAGGFALQSSDELDGVTIRRYERVEGG
jgi:mannosyltransferase